VAQILPYEVDGGAKEQELGQYVNRYERKVYDFYILEEV